MIPIADPDLGEEERRRLEAVIDDGMLADGPEVRAFEEEFAAACDADHGVATSNGTTALYTALDAVGIGPGDRVATPPFSFVATANAIRFCGAEPVFVDIDPSTYTMDPSALERRLRDGEVIDGLLPVHLYGLPADMGALARLAEEYDLVVVEDAAQAHGATCEGYPVGTFADAACFSFYPTKNMTTGEGGMIVTDRQDVAEKAARFVDHGQTDRYEYAEVGHNFRMTSLAAAIGRVQLARLPSFTERRRENARRYTERLTDADVETPIEPANRRHVYNQYTIRCDDRDRLASHLADRGIGTKVYYPTPIHHQPPYADVDARSPNAEAAAGEVLSLPVHPKVTDDEVRQIAEAVTQYTTQSHVQQR